MPDSFFVAPLISFTNQIVTTASTANWQSSFSQYGALTDSNLAADDLKALVANELHYYTATDDLGADLLVLTLGSGASSNMHQLDGFNYGFAQTSVTRIRRLVQAELLNGHSPLLDAIRASNSNLSLTNDQLMETHRIVRTLTDPNALPAVMASLANDYAIHLSDLGVPVNRETLFYAYNPDVVKRVVARDGEGNPTNYEFSFIGDRKPNGDWTMLTLEDLADPSWGPTFISQAITAGEHFQTTRATQLYFEVNGHWPNTEQGITPYDRGGEALFLARNGMKKLDQIFHPLPRVFPIELNYDSLIPSKRYIQGAVFAVAEALRASIDGSVPTEFDPTYVSTPTSAVNPVGAATGATEISFNSHIEQSGSIAPLSSNAAFIEGVGAITTLGPSDIPTVFGFRVDNTRDFNFRHLSQTGQIGASDAALTTEIFLSDSSSTTLGTLNVVSVQPVTGGASLVTFQDGHYVRVSSLNELIEGYFGLSPVAQNFNNFDLDYDNIFSASDNALYVEIPLQNGSSTCLFDLGVVDAVQQPNGLWIVSKQDGTQQTVDSIRTFIDSSIRGVLPGGGGLDFAAIDTNADGTVNGFDAGTYHERIKLVDGTSTSLAELNVTSANHTSAGWSVRTVGEETPTIYKSLDDFVRTKLGKGLYGSNIQKFADFNTNGDQFVNSADDLYAPLKLENGITTSLSALNVTAAHKSGNAWDVTFVDGTVKRFASLETMVRSLTGDRLLGSHKSPDFADFDNNGSGNINGTEDLSFYGKKIALADGTTTSFAEMNVQSAVATNDGWKVTFVDGTKKTFKSLADLVKERTGTDLLGSQTSVASLNNVGTGSAPTSTTSGVPASSILGFSRLAGPDNSWVAEMLNAIQIPVRTIADLQESAKQAVQAAKTILGFAPMDLAEGSLPDQAFESFVLALNARPFDPLALDLNNNGVEFTSVSDGIQFDLSGDGFSEQTSWVSSDDAFLALDRNDNELIDDGTELFGESTILSNGQRATTGFEALAELDSNHDGVIDSSDEQFSELKLLKGDGTPVTLANAGISSISLDYAATNIQDAFGNTQLRAGSFERTDGTVGISGDFALARQTMTATSNDLLPETEEIAMLPEVWGTGIVRSLHQSMLRDLSGTLRDLVEDFRDAASASQREALLDDILFEWTGSADLDPTSRGSLMDGRKVAVVERFMGTNFHPVVIDTTDDLMQQSYTYIKESLWTQLMLQTHLADFFEVIRVSRSANSPNSNVDVDLLNAKDMVNQAITSNASAGKNVLIDLVRALRNLQVDALSSTWTEFYAEFSSDPELKQAIDSAGHEFLTVTENATIFDARATRGAYMELIDSLETVKGGVGDDVYVFASGNGSVEIQDSGGNDRIVFNGAVTESNIYFETDSSRKLRIRVIDSADEISVASQLSAGQSTIERLQLSDGTLLDLSNQELSFYGTQSTDTIDRTAVTWSETIMGRGGADEIRLGSADTTVNAGTGNDTIYDGLGNNTYTFNVGDGNDEIELNAYADADHYLVIELGANISAEDVHYFAEGNDLLVKINTTDQILIRDALSETSDRKVIAIRFDEGSFVTQSRIVESLLEVNASAGISASNLQNITVNGTSSADQLIARNGDVQLKGAAGDDTLTSGIGNDTLTGGSGSNLMHGGLGGDVYVIDNSTGTDTIIDAAGLADTISFGSDIVLADLALQVSDSALKIVIAETGRNIIIEDYFTNATHRIENLRFADESTSSLASLVNAITVAAAEPGTTLDRSTVSANELIGGKGGGETILLGSGDNVVVLANANTSVTSGAGENTFVVATGCGAVTIDVSMSGDNDRVVFSNVSLKQTGFSRSGSDLVVSFGATDSLTLSGMFAAGNKHVSFDYADGTALSFDQVAAALLASDSTTTDLIEPDSTATVITFSVGDGVVTIAEDAGTNLGISDTIDFGTGFSAANLIASVFGNDLHLRFLDSPGDRLILKDHLTNSLTKFVEDFEFADTTTLSLSDLIGRQLLVATDSTTTSVSRASSTLDEFVRTSANDASVYLGSGDNVVIMDGEDGIASTGDGNDQITLGTGEYSVYLEAGDKLVNVGSGITNVYAGQGSVQYNFDANDGILNIVQMAQSNSGAAIDTIKLGTGLDLEDMQLSSVGYDLTLSFTGTTDSIKLTGALQPGLPKNVDVIQLADGSAFTLAQLLELGVHVDSSVNDLQLNRIFSKSNEIVNLTGTGTTFWDGSGSSTITVGDNANVVLGAGDDSVTLGGGNNAVSLGAGYKTVTMAAGNNQLNASKAQSEYIINLGGGTHTIDAAAKTAASARDNITFGAGLLAEDIYLTSNGLDLQVNFTGLADKVVIKNALSPTAVQAIDYFNFEDGEWLGFDDLLARGITSEVSLDGAMVNHGGVSFNEIIEVSGDNVLLYTGSGTNRVDVTGTGGTVVGGTGNLEVELGVGSNLSAGAGVTTVTQLQDDAEITGGTGSLIIHFGTASGHSTVTQNFTTGLPASTDTIIFGAGVTAADVVLSSVGKGLTVGLSNGLDSITLEGQLDPQRHKNIVKYKFADGTVYTATAFQLSKMIEVAAATDGTTLSRAFSTFNEHIVVSQTGGYVQGGSGDNVIDITGDSVTVMTGAGDDEIDVVGDQVTVGLTTGADTVNVTGDDVTIQAGADASTYLIDDAVTTATIQLNTNSTSTAGDTLELESALADIELSSAGANLTLTNSVSGQEITLQGELAASKAVQTFKFLSGTQKNLDELLALGVNVDATGDGLTIDRRFSTAVETITVTGNTNQVYSGNAAVQVDVAGNTNSVYLGSSSQNVEVTGDNNSLSDGAGNNTIVMTGSDNEYHDAAGNDTITASGTIILGSGTNRVVLTGDSTVTDGANADTFVFGLGSGLVTLNSSNQTGVDTVEFAAGIDIADISVATSGSDLVITLSTNDVLTVTGGNNANPWLETFSFADGMNFSPRQLKIAAQSDVVSVTPNAVIDLSSEVNAIGVYAIGGGETISTGSGADTIIAEGANATISGGAGADTLTVSGAGNTVNGNDGADTINVSGGTALVHTGDGDDEVTVSGNGNEIFVDVGADVVYVSGTGNILRAGSDSSRFVINYGATATLHLSGSGTASTDIIEFGAGIASSAIALSSQGYDLILSAGNYLNLRLANQLNPTAYRPVDNFTFADQSTLSLSALAARGISVTSNTADEVIDRRFSSYAETIVAGGTNQTIYGGSGSNLITSTGADATIHASATTTSLTSSGVNATIHAPSNAISLLISGAGSEVITPTAGSTLTLLGTAGVTVTGGTGNDSVSSSAGDVADTFNGGAGADTLTGGGGNDTLSGDDGNDSLNGGIGNDTIYGGLGVDTIGGEDGSDTVDGGGGNDEITGGNGADSLAGADGDDYVYGGAGADVIAGDAGADYLYGQEDADQITGGVGADYLSGGDGDDTLSGGSDNDTLYGGDGADTLSGGSGNDSMYGDLGADVYSFGLGDGADVLQDNNTSGAATTDAVVFGAGITVDQVIFSASGDHMVATIENTTDALTIQNQLGTATNYHVEEFRFADNTVLSRADAIARLVTVGTESGETIWGSSNNDRIYALGGNDYVYGQGGNDKLYGGADADYLSGASGNDTLYGDAGADNLSGGSGDDTMYGGDGNDSVSEESGTNSIYGELGDDTLYGGSDQDYIEGGAGSDWVDGGSGNDTLHGGTENDYIYGQLGNDTAYGGEGNDDIRGQGGADLLYGDNGNDTIQGGDDNDTIYGGAGTDTVWADGGNDTVYSGTGNDALNGGEGADTFVFASGDGTDTVDDYNGAAAGDDVVSFAAGIAPGDLIYARSGSDLVITFNGNSDQITIKNQLGSTTQRYVEKLQFANGTVITYDEMIANLPPLNGTENADTIYGTGVADTINGLGGGDSITAHEGNDTVYGGAGSDYVYGRDGNDTLYGDDGDDYIAGESDNDTMHGGAGNDTMDGGSGDDSINGNDGNEYVWGGNGNDQIDGGAGADYIWAGNGNDTVNGGADNDNLYGDWDNDIVNGNAGADVLSGGYGTDTLTGGTGNDTLEGGADNDTYKFANGDGTDSISESGYTSTDKAMFDSSIAKNDIAFFRSGTDSVLMVGYVGSTDQITVNGEFGSAVAVERFETSDGSYLTNGDIELLIQDMASYASTNSISFTSLSDVKNNSALMTIVNNAWNQD